MDNIKILNACRRAFHLKRHEAYIGRHYIVVCDARKEGEGFDFRRFFVVDKQHNTTYMVEYLHRDKWQHARWFVVDTTNGMLDIMRERGEFEVCYCYGNGGKQVVAHKD